MMKYLNPKLLIYLILAFILATVVGTLTHEGGHIAVAKYYGYETTLHYASMNYNRPSDTLWRADFDTVQVIYWRHKDAIDNDKPYPESERKDSLWQAISKVRTAVNTKHSGRIITIGGPLQTLLTSIVGIFILFYRRKSIEAKGMKLWDWLAVFLALFSLRFVSNMTLSIASEIWKPNGTYFGNGDEAKLARSLELPLGTFAIPLFCMGLAIALWVIFKVLPARYRITFILSGLIGGVLGFVLWMDWLGPILLP